MDTSLFKSSSAGRIVRTPEGYDAFVPAPLPPDIDYDRDLVLALSRADAALSELSIAGEQLPNPHLLIAPYLRQEAVLSSRIEGTHTTLSELLIDEAAGTEPERDTDMREVRNHVSALELDGGLDTRGGRSAGGGGRPSVAPALCRPTGPRGAQDPTGDALGRGRV